MRLRHGPTAGIAVAGSPGVGYDPAELGHVQVGYPKIQALDSRVASAAPWLLATYLIVPPLFKGALQPWSPIDLTVLLAIPTAAVGTGWLYLHRADLDRRQRIALWLWIALGALVTAGILWAPDRVLAASTAAYFVILAVIPLTAAFPVAADESRVRQFLLVFFGAGVVWLVIATIALFAGGLGEAHVIGTNRIGVARALAFVPLIGIPLFAWQRFGRRTWILLAIASLAVFLAVATTSRAAPLFAAAVGALMVVGALLLSPHRGRVLALAAGLAIGTLLVFVTLSSILPERAAVRFAGLVEAAGDALDEGPSGPLPGEEPEDPEDRPSSIAQRATLYRFAFALFVEHPVIGAGTSGFEVRFRAEPGIGGHQYPHNLPLQLASEFGILGLAVVGALGVLPLLTWRPRTSVSVALAALFAFLLLNAMLSNGIYENRMLWGVWLVLLAYRPPANPPAAEPPAEPEAGTVAAAR